MESGPSVVLKKEDSGTEIQVHSGNRIQVELEGLGGTGYWWHVQGLDNSLLDLFEAKARSNGMVGSPVFGIWTFEAKQKGDATITMNFYRPWEGVTKSIDHFWVRIKIR